MVETLALHEKLSLYSLTQKELEAIHRLHCSCQEIPENLDVPEKL